MIRRVLCTCDSDQVINVFFWVVNTYTALAAALCDCACLNNSKLQLQCKRRDQSNGSNLPSQYFNGTFIIHQGPSNYESV